MKLINLTPHVVRIADADGNIIREIEPTLPTARVSSTSVSGAPIDGVPFAETVFGNVENLPEPNVCHDSLCQDANWSTGECQCSSFETVYIVSQIVIAACPSRLDLVRPDTGPTAIRRDGQIYAVRGLTR